jgi:hypothetical protein
MKHDGRRSAQARTAAGLSITWPGKSGRPLGYS